MTAPDFLSELKRLIGLCAIPEAGTPEEAAWMIEVRALIENGRRINIYLEGDTEFGTDIQRVARTDALSVQAWIWLNRQFVERGLARMKSLVEQCAALDWKHPVDCGEDYAGQPMGWDGDHPRLDANLAENVDGEIFRGDLVGAIGRLPARQRRRAARRMLVFYGFAGRNVEGVMRRPDDLICFAYNLDSDDLDSIAQRWQEAMSDPRDEEASSEGLLTPGSYG